MEEFHERSRMGKMCRNVWSMLNPAKKFGYDDFYSPVSMRTGSSEKE